MKKLKKFLKEHKAGIAMIGGSCIIIGGVALYIYKNGSVPTTIEVDGAKITKWYKRNGEFTGTNILDNTNGYFVVLHKDLSLTNYVSKMDDFIIRLKEIDETF